MVTNERYVELTHSCILSILRTEKQRYSSTWSQIHTTNRAKSTSPPGVVVLSLFVAPNQQQSHPQAPLYLLISVLLDPLLLWL